MTLRAYLVWLLAMATLPILVFAGWLGYEHVGFDRRETEKHALTLTRSHVAAVDQELSSLLAALNTLADSNLLNDRDLAPFYKQAQSFLLHHGENILLVDPTGQQVVNTLARWGDPLAKTLVASELQPAFLGGGPIVTNIFFGRASKRPLVNVGVPVQRDGSVPYVLMASLATDALQRGIGRAELPEGWELLLLDGNGRFIARSLSPASAGHLAAPELVEAVQSRREQVVESVSPDGVKTQSTVVPSRLAPWSVVISMPKSVFLSSAYRHVLGVLGMLVLAIAATFAIGVVAGRRIHAALSGLASDGEAPPSGIEEIETLRLTLQRAFSKERAARREAEQANQAKVKFLAAASHDLRQPYQAMNLFLSVLSHRLTDPKDREPLDALAHAAKSGEELLSALLEVTVLESGGKQVCRGTTPITPIMEKLFLEFGATASTQCVTMRHVRSTVLVDTDPVLLGRVLRNLISNAVKYTRRGKIVFGCRRAGPCLRVEVWDTGIGIPEEHLNAIFEEFTQLANPERNRAKGLGLGLAIVEKTARLLDHRVGVHSWPGRGSVFWVEVPIAGQAVADGDQAAASPALSMLLPA